MLGAPVAALWVSAEHRRASRHPICRALLGEGAGAGVERFPGAERSHLVSVFTGAVQPRGELLCEVGG